MGEAVSVIMPGSLGMEVFRHGQHQGALLSWCWSVEDSIFAVVPTCDPGDDCSGVAVPE